MTARFAEIAERNPDRFAITDGTACLTYRDVADQARRLATDLSARLAGRTGPVAIVLPHGITFPVAMLGVLMAGRAYVPLDTTFPDERNRTILRHADAAAIVTDTNHVDAMAALGDAAIPVIDIATPGMTAVPPLPGPGDLAYIIYTSGSSGVPKGVVQNHRNLLHDVMQYSNAIHITPDDRLSLFYSPSVNGAIRDIYGALLNGASLHVLPVKDSGPDRLAAFVEAQRLTIYHSVPIVFRHLIASMSRGHRLHSVRLAYLAGDRMDRDDVLAFRRYFSSDALLFTGVGSTEVATIYAHRFIASDTPLPEGRVPVGHRIPDREFQLLNDDGVAVPDGEAGEIVVRSRYISLGYWRDPETTSRAFSDDSDDKTIRVYRTGDVGRIAPDGLLEHLGRGDRQIKLRGHRIESSEVESTLKQHDTVAEAAVLLRDAESRATLVAYVVARAGTRPVPEDLAAFLGGRLPAFMVPSRILVINELPLLPNFKIDRAAVARMDGLSTGGGTRGVYPTDPIAAAFSAVLNKRVNPDDDFFALGGDSLDGVRLMLALERTLSMPIPPGLLVLLRTPRQVGAWLTETRPVLARQVTPLRIVAQPDAILFVMSGIDGSCGDALPWLPAWPDRWNVYGVVDRAAVSVVEPADSMAELADQAIEAILATGHSGPFNLLGYSFGGRLAYETAVRLRSIGEGVAFLGMIDTPSWTENSQWPSPSTITQVRRRAIAAHRIPYCDVPISFFRTMGTWTEKPDDYFWSSTAARVDVIRLPGMHGTFGQGHNLITLARAFHDALEGRARAT